MRWLNITIKVAIFGAGKIGKAALRILKCEGKEVVCFLDNDANKWGTSIMGIPVMGLDKFLYSKNIPIILTRSDIEIK